MEEKQKTIPENYFLSWYLGDQTEEYSLEEYKVMHKVGNRTYLILIIYDVTDSKRRYRIAKKLKGYGEWVQRSAFECHLTLKQYEDMIKDILPYFEFDKDLLRIYKLTGQADVRTWGKIEETKDEDLLII